MENIIKFTVPQSNINVIFEQYKNKNWKVILESKDQAKPKKELSRSISSNKVDTLCAMLILGEVPTMNKGFNEKVKRLREIIRTIKVGNPTYWKQRSNHNQRNKNTQHKCN